MINASTYRFGIWCVLPATDVRLQILPAVDCECAMAGLVRLAIKLVLAWLTEFQAAYQNCTRSIICPFMSIYLLCNGRVCNRYDIRA